MSSNRQVHARGTVPHHDRTAYGEMVRHRGRWYLECSGTGAKREMLSVERAAFLAHVYGMEIETGLPGGRTFDWFVSQFGSERRRLVDFPGRMF